MVHQSCGFKHPLPGRLLQGPVDALCQAGRQGHPWRERSGVAVHGLEVWVLQAEAGAVPQGKQEYPCWWLQLCSLLSLAWQQQRRQQMDPSSILAESQGSWLHQAPASRPDRCQHPAGAGHDLDFPRRFQRHTTAGLTDAGAGLGSWGGNQLCKQIHALKNRSRSIKLSTPLPPWGISPTK